MILSTSLLAVIVVALVGVYRSGVTHPNPVSSINASPTKELLERGESLVRLCMGCHSGTGELPLDGGNENFSAALGSLYAPNLMPGGALRDWTEGQIIRTIRDGQQASQKGTAMP